VYILDVDFSLADSFNGDDYDSSDDDDDDDDDDDIEDDVKFTNLFPDKIKLKQDWKKSRDEEDLSGKLLTPEVRAGNNKG